MNTSPKNGHEGRDLWPAIQHGLHQRCPNCGTGKIYKSYLKVRDTCQICNQDLHHHRTDDGPAYLTILIVGHILAPLILVLYRTFRPEPLVMASLLSTGTVVLSLFLLPRLKGFMIAFQWAKQMHGFASKLSYDASQAETNR